MTNMENKKHPSVCWLEIDDENSGQRLDNFLIARLKGVPKTRIYRIIRKGEVRVNKGRVDNKYRLVAGDRVRIPPIRVAERTDEVELQPTLKYSLLNQIIYEDDVMIVVNKPAGFAVHGGSGVSSGVIEGLRALRPDLKFLDLVHRLDKGTSGCLLIAKKRSALRALHELFRLDQVSKTYLALLQGQWSKKTLWVDQPLLKSHGKGGERFVKVNPAGKSAQNRFNRLALYHDLTWVEALPKTGRTHQIRVHAAWLGHPIVGDSRYASAEFNQILKSRGYDRLFLHAHKLRLAHPVTNQVMEFVAPLDERLQALLNQEVRLA